MRLEGPDTAAQLAVLLQRDEARAPFLEPCIVADRRAFTHPERSGNRGTSDPEHSLSVLALVAGALAESKRCVADDALLSSGGVAGVAAVEQLGHELAALRREQRPEHRRRAAGLLVRQARIEAQNRFHGLAVDRASLLVGVVMREVGADDDERLRAAPEA